MYVHSTPISTEVYDVHWKMLSKTFAEIHTQGFSMTGPRVAHRVLKEVAQGMGSSEKALVAEIHRLTNVATLNEKGWDSMMLDDAINHKLIDAESASEVEGTLVFFTSGFHNFSRGTRKAFLTEALEIWNAQIISSPYTDWLNSLKTSIAAENSGKRAA